MFSIFPFCFWCESCWCWILHLSWLLMEFSADTRLTGWMFDIAKVFDFVKAFDSLQCPLLFFFFLIPLETSEFEAIRMSNVGSTRWYSFDGIWKDLQGKLQAPILSSKTLWGITSSFLIRLFDIWSHPHCMFLNCLPLGSVQWLFFIWLTLTCKIRFLVSLPNFTTSAIILVTWNQNIYTMENSKYQGSPLLPAPGRQKHSLLAQHWFCFTSF